MAYLLLIILFFLVYYDARILRGQEASVYKNHLKSSPLNWAICCALFLVIFVPIYLFRRQRFKRERERHWMEASNHPEQVPSEVGGVEGYADPVSGLTPLDYFSDCLGMIISWILWVALIDVVIYLVSAYLPIFKTELGEVLFSTILEDFLMIFLIYRVTRRYPLGGFLASVGMTKAKGSFLKIVFVPAVAGLILAYWASFERINDLHPPSTPLSQLLDSSSSLMILLFAGSAILLAPLIEEIIFRGYFYGVLSRLKGKTFAVFSVAIMFALMHVWQYWGDWLAISVVAVLGFVLSWLRAANGVTISSIVTHYVYNGFLFVFPFMILLQTHAAYFEYQWKYHKLDTPAKEALLQKSIKEEPQWHLAYNDLAWLYAEEGKNLPEALQLVDRALSLDPDNDAYLDTKAEVLYRLKRFAEAIEIEKSLVSMNPDDDVYKEQLKKFEQSFSDLKDHDPQFHFIELPSSKQNSKTLASVDSASESFRVGKEKLNNIPEFDMQRPAFDQGA